MSLLKPRTKFNVVLIGYRAVGKTSIGQQVAQKLGRPLVDLDKIVEQEAGESIADLVVGQAGRNSAAGKRKWCAAMPLSMGW